MDCNYTGQPKSNCCFHLLKDNMCSHTAMCKKGSHVEAKFLIGHSVDISDMRDS